MPAPVQRYLNTQLNETYTFYRNNIMDYEANYLRYPED